MTLFSLILITHVIVAITSVTSASMSFFVSKGIIALQSVMWSTFGLTLLSGISLLVIMPTTLGRTCAMMALLTPLAIFAHKNLQSKLLLNR